MERRGAGGVMVVQHGDVKYDASIGHRVLYLCSCLNSGGKKASLLVVRCDVGTGWLFEGG